jgi:hypothetical protein
VDGESSPVPVVELMTFATRNPVSPAIEIRCNFGIFAGREATPAELDDLAHALLRLVRDVSVVSEQRREVGQSSEAALHQVRVQLDAEGLPKDDAEVEQLVGRLVHETERWAESCVAERSLADP